ncbi:MAG TPA: FkbM family methyltransferase [Thermoanaerobaculia bacterium]
MIRKRSTLRRKARSFLARAMAVIENNDNADFQTNGERRFVERLFALLRERFEPPLVLFDVGANAGHYSAMLLQLADPTPVQLHAFEPAAGCVLTLRARFGADPRVRIAAAAVSNDDGMKRLYFDEPGSGLASLYDRDLSLYAMSLGQSEDVPTIRLDRYIEREAIAHVHFLKLDIEGHEAAALEGLGRYLDPAFLDFVQFEYGGTNLDSNTTLRQLFSTFTSRGFRIAKIMKKGLELREYEVAMENYQYSNYVAVAPAIADALA